MNKKDVMIYQRYEIVFLMDEPPILMCYDGEGVLISRKHLDVVIKKGLYRVYGMEQKN